MSGPQALGTTPFGFGTATSPFTGTSPTELATSLVARASVSGNVDTAALNRDLAELARTDPTLAAQARTQAEAQLTPVERGNLARPVTGTLPDGSPVAFSPDGLEQGRWIDTIRTSTNPAERATYDNLVRTAGSTDPEAIKAVLANAYTRATGPDQTGQPAPAPANDNPGILGQIANAADAINPVNRLTDLVQSGAAEIGRRAGLGNTEWGGRLQTLLETPGTAAAFRQGLSEGILEGGKDMVVGVASLAGRGLQYGADRSLSGFAGDALRGVTGGLPGWVDAIIPSTNRAEATEASVSNTAGAIGDYISSRASNPGLIADDATAAFDKAWGSLKADHAAAAAQGPEAEARWFGQAIGRVTFEVGSTFIPVAGVAGKVDKAADGLRAAEGLGDAARVADGALPNPVDDLARLTGPRLVGSTLVIDANRGRSFSIDGANGRIGDAPAVRSDGDRLLTRDVDGNDVVVRQPRTFDSRVVQADGSIVYTKGNMSVTYDANGFPVFRGTRADLFLDPSHIKSADDGAHFRAANTMMRDALSADPGLAQQIGLTPAQIAFLQRANPASTAPPGLTWHHHQDTGRIQLVDRAEHFAFPGGHVGGMKLWGGGRD